MKLTTKPLITVDAGLADALWANFVAPVLSGDEGQVQEVRLGAVDRLADLFPVGAVQSELRLEAQRMVLAAGRDWAAVALRWAHRPDVHVIVRAASEEALDKAVAMVRSNAPVAERDDDGRIAVDFWQSAGAHTYTTERAIDAPAWGDIEGNYPADVGGALADLAGRRPGSGDGRIVLWHGPR